MIRILLGINGEAFVNLSQYCPLLERIDIGSTKIGDKTFAEIGKLQSLKDVAVAGSNISVAGITSLVDGYNNFNVDRDGCLLEVITLDVIIGIKISNSSISIIANNCPYLKSIQMCGNAEMISVDALVNLI